MRLIFAVGCVALLASAATFACSSASPATATSDAGTSSGATTSGGTSGTTTSSGGTSGTTSSSGATTDPDAGDDDTSDAGDAGTIIIATDGGLSQNSDAGSDCDPDAFGEVEPNDDATTANQLPVNGLGSFKFCGTVSSTDTDDFVTFVMPANVRGYGIPSIKATGNIDVSGTIGGADFDATQGSFPNNRKAGDVWIVDIHTDGNSARAYQLTFQFQ